MFEIIDGLLVRYTGDEEAVTILDGVTAIGEKAFWKCRTLKSVIIPDSVRSIGKRAFSGCTNLEKIVIPDSVETVGAVAFSGCEHLREVRLPAGLKSLSKGMFQLCIRLEQIELPAQLVQIREGAFSHCVVLREIYVPASVETIEDKAFTHCYCLQRVVIENGKLGMGVFTECSALSQITVKDATVAYSSSLFDGSHPEAEIMWGTERIDRDFTIINGILVSYQGTAEGVRIPAVVRGIGQEAFKNCPELQKLIIPKTVLAIEKEAISQCETLRQIIVENKDVTYSSDIFNGIHPEAEIIWGTERIDRSFVIETGVLVSYQGAADVLRLPDVVRSIGPGGIKNCSQLQELIIPAAVSAISKEAVSGCYNLRRIVVENKDVTYSSDIFNGIHPEAEIIWGTERIDRDFEIEDRKLVKYQGQATVVRVPSVVRSVDMGAFWGCPTLEELIIPKSVNFFEVRYMMNCPRLRRLVVENGSILFDSRIFAKIHPEAEVIWGGEKMDRSFMIFDGTLLRYSGRADEVHIPHVVRHIGAKVFRNRHDIHRLIIPPEVNSIGEDAFVGWKKGQTVIIEGRCEKKRGVGVEQYPRINNAFDRKANCTVQAPEGLQWQRKWGSGSLWYKWGYMLVAALVNTILLIPRIFKLLLSETSWSSYEGSKGEELIELLVKTLLLLPAAALCTIIMVIYLIIYCIHWVMDRYNPDAWSSILLEILEGNMEGIIECCLED